MSSTLLVLHVIFCTSIIIISSHSNQLCDRDKWVIRQSKHWSYSEDDCSVHFEAASDSPYLWFGSQDGYYPNYNYSFPSFILQTTFKIDASLPSSCDQIGPIFRQQSLVMGNKPKYGYFLRALGQYQHIDFQRYDNSSAFISVDAAAFTLDTNAIYTMKIIAHQSLYSVYINDTLLLNNTFDDHYNNGTIGFHAMSCPSTLYSLTIQEIVNDTMIKEPNEWSIPRQLNEWGSVYNGGFSSAFAAFNKETATVFVFGGFHVTGPNWENIYLLDLREPNIQWAEIKPTVPNSINGQFHSPISNSVYIANLVYFVGWCCTGSADRNFYTGSPVIFDMNQNNWVNTDTGFWGEYTNLPYNTTHGCLTTNNTHLIYIGGVNETNYFNTLQIFDIDKKKWYTQKIPFSQLLNVSYDIGFKDGYCMAVKDVVYVFGGNFGNITQNKSNIINPTYSNPTLKFNGTSNKWSYISNRGNYELNRRAVMFGEAVMVKMWLILLWKTNLMLELC